MIEKLQEQFPNIPKPVLNEWLLPFTNDIGLPDEHERWNGILGFRDVEFWKNTTWEKRKIHTRSLIVETLSKNTLKEMFNAFFLGQSNYYSIQLGERSKTRCHIQLQQLIQHGRFLNPIILFDFGKGLEIIDGNHRLTSFLGYHFLLSQPVFQENLKTMPSKLYQFNESWVGKPST